MITYTYNNFIKLDYLFTSMERNSSNNDVLKNIFVKIGESLNHLRGTLSPYTIHLAKELSPLLEALGERVQKYKSIDQQVSQIAEELFKLKAEIEAAPLHENPAVYRFKIDFKWMMFLDIDFPDDTGHLCKSIAYYFERKVPFITTRSILSAHHVDEENDRVAIRKELEKAVFDSQEEWSIYQQHDPTYGHEFILFLPKKFSGRSLESLDLAVDGSLKPISVVEAFRGPERRASLDAFFHLFSSSPPKLNTLFDLEGHGHQTKVGGLSKENCLRLLDFFERRRCKGFVIRSCNSGGESSLFLCRGRKRSFPIIVGSIGDFEIYGGQEAEKKVDLFLDELATFLETGDQTTVKLRHVFNRVEKGVKAKHPFNLAKVNFMHTSHSLEGFKPIGESDQGESLTYLVARRAQLCSSKLSINKTYLHLHPQVTSVPIEWEQTNFVLHSMIPGNGRHLLRSLKLSSGTTEDFIKRMCEAYHPKFLMLVCKGFFIGSLQSKIDEENELNEVVIYISPFNKPRCLYRKKDIYYLTEGETTHPLTPFQHALYVKEVERRTEPKAEALRLSTGGQEEIKDFEKALRSDEFYPAGSQSLRWLLDFEAMVKDPKSLLDRMRQAVLGEGDRVQLALALEEMKCPDLALSLYREMKFDANVKNLSQISFVILAAINGNIPLIKELVKQGGDVNVRNPVDLLNSPLHYACLSEDLCLLDALLDRKEVNFKIKNFDLANKQGEGWTALSYTLPHKLPFLAKMIEKGGNSLSDAMGECLQELVHHYSLSKLEVFLNVIDRAVIHKGDFLKRVFQENDLELFEKLAAKIQIITEENGKDQMISFGVRYAALYSSQKVFRQLSSLPTDN